jgi:hypothetical protein
LTERRERPTTGWRRNSIIDPGAMTDARAPIGVDRILAAFRWANAGRESDGDVGGELFTLMPTPR